MAIEEDNYRDVVTAGRRHTYLSELTAQVQNPMHKRIVEAYSRSGTVEGAEAELATIIEEVLRED